MLSDRSSPQSPPPPAKERCRYSAADVFEYSLDLSEGREDALMQRHVAQCSKCRAMLEDFIETAEVVTRKCRRPRSAIDVPEHIDGFRVVGQLGQGGMGRVWKAFDLVLERFLAIKVMREELSEKPELCERFFFEARTTARLSHPNIVQVHGIGQHENHAYIAMEYIEGESLTEIIALRRLEVSSAIHIFRQLLEAIEAAHSAKIIHRDIKPSNIMVCAGERVKILDFGLAREIRSSPVSSLTLPGAVLGTLTYMAPEVATGKRATIQSDIYSLGLVLFEMLTGHLPHTETNNPLQLIERIKSEPLPAPSSINPNVPRYLDWIVHRMCAKSPHERYLSARAILTELDNAHSGKPSLSTGADFELEDIAVSPQERRSPPSDELILQETPAKPMVRKEIHRSRRLDLIRHYFWLFLLAGGMAALASYVFLKISGRL
jgi:serine/threonine-protein kinase